MRIFTILYTEKMCFTRTFRGNEMTHPVSLYRLMALQ